MILVVKFFFILKKMFSLMKTKYLFCLHDFFFLNIYIFYHKLYSIKFILVNHLPIKTWISVKLKSSLKRKLGALIKFKDFN